MSPNYVHHCDLRAVWLLPRSLASRHGHREDVSPVGYIRTEAVKSAADLWVNIAGPQHVLAFQNLGMHAPVGTMGWQKYELSVNIPAGTVYINFGALLNGSGTAWFDKLSVDLDGQPYAANPTTEQVQWIKGNAIPFSNLNLHADYTELLPLKSSSATHTLSASVRQHTAPRRSGG